MAKTYRIRRYYKKHQWSTRLTNFSGTQSVVGGNNYVIYTNLCQNPTQTDTTVSNKFTVKNICIDFELSSTLTQGSTNQNYLENFQYFVMFIPQGYIPTGTPSAYEQVPFDHPEWIMAHRYIGVPLADSSTSYPPIRIKSRLARKLDTGDRVVLIVLGNHSAGDTTSVTVEYRGLVKYNTKAN